MADHNHKKQDQGKSVVNSVVAAVTGAVVGAGVAVAGAIALSDKKNRENVKKALTNAKDQAVGYVEDMQKQARAKKSEIDKKLAEGKKEVKKAVNS